MFPAWSCACLMLTWGSSGPACQAATLECPLICGSHHGPFSASRPHPSMEPLECRQRWAQVTLQPSTGTDTDLTSDSLLPGGGLATSLLSLLQVYRMPHDMTRVPCGTRAAFIGCCASLEAAVSGSGGDVSQVGVQHRG